MVSKLDILARYYQIYVENIHDGYFQYNGNYYYITNQKLDENTKDIYIQYIQQLQISGFIIIKNIMHSYHSEGHYVYQYEYTKLAKENVIKCSMIPYNKKYGNIEDTKKHWAYLLDNAHQYIAKYASSIEHNEHYVVLFYYYQALGESAINVLNQALKNNKKASIQLSISHRNHHEFYEYLINPYNVLLAPRIRDIAFLYCKGEITINELEKYINEYKLNATELCYLYARILFPSPFLQLINEKFDDSIFIKKHIIEMYKKLPKEIEKIILVQQLLDKYQPTKRIHWLYNCLGRA